MTPIFLSNSISWFGSHSGYQQLPRYVAALAPESRVIASKPGVVQRLLGKAYSLKRGWGVRNQSDAAAELRFYFSTRSESSIAHILHLEDHLQYLDRWEKAPSRIIGTIHQPSSRWPENDLPFLKRLSSAIVLYRAEIPFFESHVGAGRVGFVPHGVDTEFFAPDASVPPVANEILFSGHYLRNIPMLQRMVERLSRRRPELRFNLLVPERFRQEAAFLELKGRANVRWHQKLSDEELRTLIRRNFLVMLPMNDSGANTAIVEAISCGTPVVTTDVGGIRDYGGGDLFPVVANDDDAGMEALVERYLETPGWRTEISTAVRAFAKSRLAWPVVAAKHLELFQELGR